MKKPLPLQVELDSYFFRGYLLKAQRAFERKSDISSKSISYICFSPSGFKGALENPKPSFWSEKLSHIFASGNFGKIEKPAQRLNIDEKKRKSKEIAQRLRILLR